MSHSIVASPELFGALVGTFSDSQLLDFSSNPRLFLEDYFDIEGDLSINVVSNSSRDIHLALPFYSGLVSGVGSEVSDDEMAVISGSGDNGVIPPSNVITEAMAIQRRDAWVNSAEGQASIARDKAHLIAKEAAEAAANPPSNGK